MQLSWRKKLESFIEAHTTHVWITYLIMANALVMGLEAILVAKEPIRSSLILINETIVFIFLVEVILRLIAMGPRYFKNPWNLFDVGIIIVSLFPYTTGFSVFRAFRVLRLLLLVDTIPHMRHIITSLKHSAKGIVNTFLIVVLIFYVYSVLGVKLFHHPQIPHFDGLAITMKTLFQVLTGDDWTAIMREVEAVYPWGWMYFISFYIVATFIVLNLLIGVVVNALQSAEEELEAGSKEDPLLKEVKALRRDIREVKAKLNELRDE